MLAIVGDIHGNFYKFREVVQEIIMKQPEITAIIQVGDFGYYPNLMRQLQSLTFPCPVYWIDGNHEYFKGFSISDGDGQKKNFPGLDEVREVTEIHPNIFYVPRGTILELDGKKIAFLGGAASVDKDIRRSYGMHWSPLENISPPEVLRFGDVDKVDMMITHCPPQSVIQKNFDPKVLVEYFGLPITWRDPNADIVEKVWERFGKPPLYCGHMHRSVTDGNCKILHIEEVTYIP